MTVDLPVRILQIAGYGLISHFALSFLLHRMVIDDALHERLFAFPPFGGLLMKKPWQIRGKYLWPWTSVPSELAEQSVGIRAFFWMARVAGFVAIASFLLFIGVVFFEGVANIRSGAL
jgi:hypothetical protein